MPTPLFFLFFLFTLSILISSPSSSLPLSTSSRWIIDASGQRTKLACVNWAAHLEPAIAEGLNKQPLDYISKQVSSLGFNCVRLTWPLDLVTNQSLGSLTVEQSLQRIGLVESLAGVRANNPQLVQLTLLQAFQAVISSLARNNLMVILDNQITKPGWCCSRYDDNGFFGDKYFDSDEWLLGLQVMATLVNSTTNVVGMSLRNELRGPLQNVSLWYRYMQRGAEVVHAANPSVLVILSGLDYDKDLSFLSDKQVELTFSGKLVYELHWYGFSDGGDWENGDPNEVCAMVVGNFSKRGGFLIDQGWPLFLSEFGVDQSGANIADNRFLSCFLSVAADLDFDWALWALQGSYYTREGQLGYDESYGVLGWDWCKARNSTFVQRLAAIQTAFQGPGLPSDTPHNMIFHPATGLCIVRKSGSRQLELGQCTESESWIFTRRKNLMLKGIKLCLHADGEGMPANLATNCRSSNSKWELTSDTRMLVSTKLPNNGSSVCIDTATDGTILTNRCKCNGDDQGTCSPEGQWFKIIRSNRGILPSYKLYSFSL